MYRAGHKHELFPVKPVDAGRAIVGRHDGSKDLLGLGDSTRSRIWYFYVLLSEASVLLVQALLRCKASSLLLLSVP